MKNNKLTEDDDNNKDNGDKPVADNVISFEDFKKGKVTNSSTLLAGTGEDMQEQRAGFPRALKPGMRRYFIDLIDGSLEITGFVGLNGAFLAIGDEEGRIKFGVAAGQWLTVTDVTDTNLRLEDFENDNDDDPSAA